MGSVDIDVSFVKRLLGWPVDIPFPAREPASPLAMLSWLLPCCCVLPFAMAVSETSMVPSLGLAKPPDFSIVSTLRIA